jgi:transposase
MSGSVQAVIGGVDCHAEHHHAVALDGQGRMLGDARFPASRAGYRDLLQWFVGQGEPQMVGVESTGSYGAGLTRFLVSSGVRVIEVNRPHAHLRHRRGKSDAVDAEAAARKVLAGDVMVVPKDTSGVVEAIRQLKVVRHSAVKARTQALVQLRDLVTTAPDELREMLAGMTLRQQVGRCRRLRPDQQHLQQPAEAAKLALRSLARRIAALDHEVAELDRALAPLVRGVAPRTTELLGVGVVIASQLLVTAGENIDRLRNEGVFAHLCGVDPIPASSGKTTRHRLNPGGDRAANAALHMIAIVRLRYCPRTRAYAARRTGEGRSKKDIIRCLKRYIAREVYHTLRADLLAPPTA